MLPLQGAQLQYPVREIRSHVLRTALKKKNLLARLIKKRKKEKLREQELEGEKERERGHNIRNKSITDNESIIGTIDSKRKLDNILPINLTT